MNDIVREYAAGLFALAEEDGAGERILAETTALTPLITRDYRRLLSDPAVPKADRLRMVEEAFGGRVHPYLLNFIRLMTERGLAAEIPGCFREYGRLWREANNVLQVRAESASALTPEQRERLEERLGARTGQRVEVEYAVNPALLGGMRLFYDNRQLDDTIRRRLTDIAEKLSGAQV